MIIGWKPASKPDHERLRNLEIVLLKRPQHGHARIIHDRVANVESQRHVFRRAVLNRFAVIQREICIPRKSRRSRGNRLRGIRTRRLPVWRWVERRMKLPLPGASPRDAGWRRVREHAAEADESRPQHAIKAPFSRRRPHAKPE